MSRPGAPVVVVGAGLAGLACTVALHDAGVPVTVLQASDGVGGRVRNSITRFWLKNPNPQAIDVGLKTSRPPASPTLDSSRLADVLFD